MKKISIIIPVFKEIKHLEEVLKRVEENNFFNDYNIIILGNINLRKLNMGLVREITDSNFENEVLKSQNISIVDFWAPWCGPCRKMSVVIDEVANEFEGRINVFKINTDENLKSAKEYSISGLPSILIFKGGKAIERLVGLMPKNTLANNIKKYLD